VEKSKILKFLKYLAIQMGYNVEIAFDMIKHGNVSELKEIISSFALKYNCDHYYYHYEMDYDGKFNRNHCIVIVNFDDNETFNCARFVKTIKRINGLHIECIYEDTHLCKLIYASQFYLKNVDKDRVIIYNKFKRERSYSDNENMLLEVIEKKPRSGSLVLDDVINLSP
jgi:hypothetical protein